MVVSFWDRTSKAKHKTLEWKNCNYQKACECTLGRIVIVCEWPFMSLACCMAAQSWTAALPCNLKVCKSRQILCSLWLFSKDAFQTVKNQFFVGCCGFFQYQTKHSDNESEVMIILHFHMSTGETTQRKMDYSKIFVTNTQSSLSLSSSSESPVQATTNGQITQWLWDDR